ncbi:hypothetical protein BRADI_1g69455v3 [Brachypodium distachyon]|uniref:Uncharacterized protein n=1 Tax=Brachypodium distachyon TaxID=15368 RepID=A0A0Q3SCU8_BRADI|nr:hypothetical protein BRADI_1g69455v3 [Brachypodium distachyon]
MRPCRNNKILVPLMPFYKSKSSGTRITNIQTRASTQILTKKILHSTNQVEGRCDQTYPSCGASQSV